MGIPLVLSDINYLNLDNVGIMGTAGSTIGSWIWSTVSKSVIFLLVMLLFFLFKKKVIVIKKIKVRLFCTIISIISIILFILISKFNSTFVIKYFFGTEPVTISQQVKENVNCQYGFYQGTIIEALMNIKRTPENYSKQKSQSQINNIKKENNEKKWEKANIVFLLSESFLILIM